MPSPFRRQPAALAPSPAGHRPASRPRQGDVARKCAVYRPGRPGPGPMPGPMPGPKGRGPGPTGPMGPMGPMPGPGRGPGPNPGPGRGTGGGPTGRGP
ncbi:hypothetical protein C3Y92_00945 [Solidesulfovibrio carbinolicus]|uniref:Uncharacterized protein n=1 Tax=Solidesulfovibrio carbinolicus TaxID=296842 RepID=A0A4P6HJB2_9BACT|nr:hypothetical protein C3Y92_00945 [Solidesulfovibrio carbinolicus]